MTVEQMHQLRKPYLLGLIAVVIVLFSEGLAAGKDEQVLKVTATAYNSLPGQIKNDKIKILEISLKTYVTGYFISNSGRQYLHRARNKAQPIYHIDGTRAR